MKKPIVAIMYDFDKTLCTKDMQEYTFIPSLAESAKEFWEETTQLARKEKMDAILTYMYLMLKKSKAKNKKISRQAFIDAGRDIELYPGVNDWFDRIKKYGLDNGVCIEHYIISSGLKEIIEGCPISDKFKQIYACEFHYDVNGVADWPKTAVNYTNKTQYLFRINKGILDLSNDRELNKFVHEDDRRVPFRNMIYIGDGMTDVPCMKLVKLNGGHSIAVYKKDKTAGNELLKDRRVDYTLKADYREGKELDSIVKNIIEQIAITSTLVSKHREQIKRLS